MHTATQERIIRPARNVYGSLRLPGDKSISHRYGMLAAFAEGTSRFTNFSTGADCASTLACMQALGAIVARQDDGTVAVTGVGGEVTPSDQALDCGNSGSTMRMISGLLAPQAGTFTLIGDASLSRRPMERIRTPLETMGARLTLTEGHAPITIRWRHASGHRLCYAGAQCAGEDLRFARGVADGGHHDGAGIGSHARP